jgi:hypothetical protein
MTKRAGKILIAALIGTNALLAKDLLAQFPCDVTCTPQPGQQCNWICSQGAGNYSQGCSTAASGSSCGNTECGPRPIGGCNAT